jgi:putative two-component system response regulator
MNTHSIIGERILNNTNVEIFNLASKIALSHHEKYDGSGYPYGLEGKHIPFAGRIVSIVDYFDVLTMDRCYRPALKDEVVYEMIK